MLGDIEIAQSLQKDKDKKPIVLGEVPHPLDVNYSLLNTKLEHLKTGDDEFKAKTMSTYISVTFLVVTIFSALCCRLLRSI